jgi:hypothetical protein
MGLYRAYKMWIALVFYLLLYDTAALSAEAVPKSLPQKPQATTNKLNSPKKSLKKNLGTKSEEDKRVKASDLALEQTKSLDDTSQDSLTDSQKLAVDGSIYIGSYSARGFESGLMAAVSLLDTPPSSTYFGVAVLAELGVHRARWSHNHVSYNRFAVTADARVDIVSNQPIQPFVAIGIGHAREWFHRADKAEVDTITSVKIGTLVTMTPSIAVRFELVPALSAVRLGSTFKL